MQNPSKIAQPSLKSPVGNGKKNKGNMPYLKQRRKLRKVVF